MSKTFTDATVFMAIVQVKCLVCFIIQVWKIIGNVCAKFAIGTIKPAILPVKRKRLLIAPHSNIKLF